MKMPPPLRDFEIGGGWVDNGTTVAYIPRNLRFSESVLIQCYKAGLQSLPNRK